MLRHAPLFTVWLSTLTFTSILAWHPHWPRHPHQTEFMQILFQSRFHIGVRTTPTNQESGANSLLFFHLTGFLTDTHWMKLVNYWGTEKYFYNVIKKKHLRMTWLHFFLHVFGSLIPWSISYICLVTDSVKNEVTILKCKKLNLPFKNINIAEYF